MKAWSLNTRWSAVILILLLHILATLAEAGTLKGTVKGRDGQLKKHVRVEIGGPETKTTFTKKDGTFSIQLQGGKYTIRIVEKNNSMKFKVKVPKTNETTQKTFKLK
jgi:hypothetical protein